MKVRTSIIVSSATRADEVARRAGQQAPHFHCAGLDAGAIYELYYLLSRERRVATTVLLRSKSTASTTVNVFALSTYVLERFAAITRAESIVLATQWADNSREIRLAKPAKYYGDVIHGIARLARLALRTNEELLMRVECSGAYNSLLQSTREARGRAQR